MKFKEFMNMYDDWNGILKVNNNNLDTIVKGKTVMVMERLVKFNPFSKVQTYDDLFNMEVVSFGFYDGEFCVRVEWR